MTLKNIYRRVRFVIKSAKKLFSYDATFMILWSKDGEQGNVLVEYYSFDVSDEGRKKLLEKFEEAFGVGKSNIRS